ncbi:putative sphingolipid transporter spinster-like 3, partial [Cucurbita argyrosperma subsp. argyrosperma]
MYDFLVFFSFGELLLFDTHVYYSFIQSYSLLLSDVTLSKASFYRYVHSCNSHLPINFVCLHCVTPSLRPLSMSMSTIAIQIFGDVPSSNLVGVVEVSCLEVKSILYVFS